MSDENTDSGTQDSAQVSQQANSGEATNNEPSDNAPREADGAEAAVQPNSRDGKVEFTPEQQKAFNRVYAKSMTAERQLQELQDVARQQSEIINQLSSSQQHIVNHIQTNDYMEAEGAIKSQIKAAYQAGDIDGLAALNAKLVDITLERKMAEKTAAQAKEKPQPQQRQQAAMATGDFVEMAVNQGAISRSDADVYRSWENETDQYGNFVRPWVKNSDMHSPAAIEGRAVFSNPAHQNKSFADKLKEIDRRMGVANQTGGANVLSSANLTRSAKTSNIKLSEFAERTAIRTKFAGPGKTAQDHIAAYKAQMEQVRGVRK